MSERGERRAGLDPVSPEDAVRRQLAYLLDELDALKPVIARIPDVLLSEAPLEGLPSVKQLFEFIGRSDRTVRAENVARILTGAGEALLTAPTVDEESNVERRDMLAVLEGVQDARRGLLEVLEGLGANAWKVRREFDGQPVNLLSYLHGVVLEDLELLRTIAERLYESRPA